MGCAHSINLLTYHPGFFIAFLRATVARYHGQHRVNGVFISLSRPLRPYTVSTIYKRRPLRMSIWIQPFHLDADTISARTMIHFDPTKAAGHFSESGVTANSQNLAGYRDSSPCMTTRRGKCSFREISVFFCFRGSRTYTTKVRQ